MTQSFPATSFGPSPLFPSDLLVLLEMGLVHHTTNRKSASRLLPLCIWGPPGIGKTELVQSFARERDLPLTIIHPAQFEEMGDLLGMPYQQKGQTCWAPPSWVPVQPGPGILLLDDLNRADARILNGIMSLLQMGRLASWNLPAQWWIVATANPEELAYAVTPMDDAIAGRMQHVHLQFDPASWFTWAATQALDVRGLGFLETYPAILGMTITPRQAAQFLEMLSSIPSSDSRRLQLLAGTMLPPEWVERFMTWMTMDQPDWFVAEHFLALEDPQTPLRSLDQKLAPQRALACKLELLHGISDALKEQAVLEDRIRYNLIELLSDPQINGNLILAFLHRQSTSSPIHKMILDDDLLRGKIT